MPGRHECEDGLKLIVVTGSTGTIGRELIRLLSAAGAEARAVSRHPATAPDLPHVTSCTADLGDPRQVEAALVGADSVFLLTGNDPGFARLQTGVIEFAARAGVAHLVKLSALGASDHSRSAIGRDHWAVERALQRTAIPWTILRPHAFMQNWLGEVAESVRAEHTIYSAIGDGRVPFIDTRDIAAVAAEVLLHGASHAGKKYVLTGGEAVGYADLATTLTGVTGRHIVYRPISMEEARARLERRGVPAALIEASLALAAYQRDGGPTAQVSPTVGDLLGRSPRTIADFARDYAEAFGLPGR
ncbi:MAG TPA: SDR family oxidoreductase [Gemmatimonadales bacterium]